MTLVLTIITKNNVRIQNIRCFKCISKLKQLHNILLDQKLSSLNYRLSYAVSEQNLTSFFKVAEMNTITNEMITYFNFFDFFKLSVDFEFKELENEIHTFIDQHNIKIPKKEFLHKDDLLQFYDTFTLDTQGNDYISVLSISANVLSITLPLPYPYLKSISVDSNNCVFTSIDGILYSKNLDQLIYIPPNHLSSTYKLFSSITSICDSAFSVWNLESIHVESNNQHFSSIDGILYSKNLDTILCFPAKHKFSSYCIPTSVTSIGNFAFSHCLNLQSIIVDSNNLHFASIEGILFTKDFTSIICFPSKHRFSTYKIPTSVTSIGNSAFYDCYNLQSITIPTNVTSIGNFAFSHCLNLQSIIVESNNLHFASIEGILFTKDFTSMICFPSKHRFSTYKIPTSVTSIGNSAFYDCYNLQSITIPTNVTSIGDSAFRGCYNLQSITIPTSVTSIGDSAFRGCSNLQSITIPTSVTSIGDSAFRGCSHLHSITVPTNVTSIGNSVFFNCKKLQSITIPTNVTSIGDSAFCGCSHLQSITIPTSVTSIGNSVFYDCYNLQSITIPTSVTSIGNSVYYDCYNLQSIRIPTNVTSIGNSVFFNCKKLQSITIPTNVTSIGDSAFCGCSHLQSITIPTSVTSIGDYAFSECFNLQSITIPTSVTSIGDYAFSECSNLQSITIPTNVASIDNFAFHNCSNLHSVSIPHIFSVRIFGIFSPNQLCEIELLPVFIGKCDTA